MFLALNGFSVRGTGVESLYDPFIPKRLEFWSRYGDVSTFSYAHEDLFEVRLRERTYTRIILQDTLHHLEPIGSALRILHQSLEADGKIIAIEENGRNLFQRVRLLLR